MSTGVPSQTPHQRRRTTHGAGKDAPAEGTMTNDGNSRDQDQHQDQGALAPGSVTRRTFLWGGAVVTATVVTGCGSSASEGTADGGPPPDGGSPDGGSPDGSGATDATSSDGGNREPVWATIPPQAWVVGVPVHLDLADYCTDADGDALAFSLSHALPAGLTLNGSVISGTPTSVFPTTAVTASADDGHA